MPIDLYICVFALFFRMNVFLRHTWATAGDLYHTHRQPSIYTCVYIRGPTWTGTSVQIVIKEGCQWGR